jgi:peroxin-7
MDIYYQCRFPVYSCRFCPFADNLLIASTSQYYGIVGNGEIVILNFNGQNGAIPIYTTTTQDATYDVCFSEKNPKIFASVQGDGTVKIFNFVDYVVPNSVPLPLASVKAHGGEIYSIDWNIFNRDFVVTASWDKSAAVTDASAARVVHSFPGMHDRYVYSAVWSPHRASVFATAGGDGVVNLVDAASGQVGTSWKGHLSEILTVEFQKYNDNILYTGSVDRTTKLWDARNTSAPVQVQYGHKLAVRKVKADPHCPENVLSCSYDMTVLETRANQAVRQFQHHKEFVIGIDYSLQIRNLVCSGSWDKFIRIWNI